MPRGPKGEKRPADVIGNAVHVMRIATGEEVEVETISSVRGHEGGKVGGPSRAASLSKERRREIAKRAATARWEEKVQLMLGRERKSRKKRLRNKAVLNSAHDDIRLHHRVTKPESVSSLLSLLVKTPPRSFSMNLSRCC